MPGSVGSTKSGVPREGKWGVSLVGPCVSVEEVMGVEPSRQMPVHEGSSGPRLADVGVSTARGGAGVSQKQDRACPSQSGHGSRARWQGDDVRGWVAAWRYLSSVREGNRIAVTRALQKVASELLLFLQDHDYRFECMMEPERVFSGHRLNPSRILEWFGRTKGFPEAEKLARLAEHGVPVCVASGGDLTFALRYENHSSADMYSNEITDKIRDDVRLGRAFVFPREAAARIPGLRVSPLAVMKSSTKLRVVHDLTFASGTSTTGVNGDTDFSSAPTCELKHVLRDIIWRILYLRQRFGRRARIVLSKMDVKDAFRQVPVEITRAPVFGYVFGDLVVVDRRLQFGWRNSPGFWCLFSSALEHAHNNTSHCNAVCTDSGREA